LPEEEGEHLHSCEEILHKVFCRVKLGPMGSPPGRPTHCVSLTTAPRPCMINLLTRFISNWINTVKLQLVRQYQRLPLDDFPKIVIRDYDGE
jgi:hypothetical protein